MKRLLLTALAAAVLWLLAGCSGDGGPSNIVGAADPKLASEPVDPRPTKAPPSVRNSCQTIETGLPSAMA